MNHGRRDATIIKRKPARRCAAGDKARRRARNSRRKVCLEGTGSELEICRSPEIPLAAWPLNPAVQGGGYCDVSGFPSGGHAHQHQRGAPSLLLIGSGVLATWRIPQEAGLYPQPFAISQSPIAENAARHHRFFRRASLIARAQPPALPPRPVLC